MYVGTLIAVKNIEKIYHDILDMNVIGDFSANIQLDGGLFLQTLDTWSSFINNKEVWGTKSMPFLRPVLPYY